MNDIQESFTKFFDSLFTETHVLTHLEYEFLALSGMTVYGASYGNGIRAIGPEGAPIYPHLFFVGAASPNTGKSHTHFILCGPLLEVFADLLDTYSSVTLGDLQTRMYEIDDEIAQWKRDVLRENKVELPEDDEPAEPSRHWDNPGVGAAVDAFHRKEREKKKKKKKEYRLKTDEEKAAETPEAVAAQVFETPKQHLRKLLKEKREVQQKMDNPPMWATTNITGEAIVENLISSNNFQLLCAPDAKESLQIASGLYRDGKTDTGTLLSLHTGEPIMKKRVKGPPIVLKDPRGAMYWSCTPKTLGELLANKEFIGDGFVSRMIFFTSPKLVSDHALTDERKGAKNREQYKKMLKSNVERFLLKNEAPVEIRFEADACAALAKWGNDLKDQIRGPLLDIHDSASRWSDHVYRIAMILHLMENHGCETNKIKLATVKRACNFGDWLVKLLLKVWAPMREETQDMLPPAVADLIKKHGSKGFTLRDAKQRESLVKACGGEDGLKAQLGVLCLQKTLAMHVTELKKGLPRTHYTAPDYESVKAFYDAKGLECPLKDPNYVQFEYVERRAA